MSNPSLLSVATTISTDWAQRGGPPSEFAIACCDDAAVGIVEMPVDRRWDDAARRATLGALAPLTRCGTFGYIADTTATIAGRPGDALLLLELEIVDAVERTVGAKVHMAPYRRSTKRFGKDLIQLDGFGQCESPIFGGMVDELMSTWHLTDDRGRLGAMNILSETGAQLSDLHPTIQQELEALLAQSA